MMMKDFAEKGYKVVVSSMFGDVEYSLADFEKGLEQDEEVFDYVKKKKKKLEEERAGCEKVRTFAVRAVPYWA